MPTRTTTMMTISVLAALLGGCSDSEPGPAGGGDSADIDDDELMPLGPGGMSDYELDPGESVAFGMGRLVRSWQFSLAQDTGAMRMELYAHDSLIAAGEGEQLTVTAVGQGVVGTAAVKIQNIGDAPVTGTVTFATADLDDARSDPASIEGLAGGPRFELAPGDARGYGPGRSSGPQQHAVTSDGRVRVEMFSEQRGELLSRAEGKNLTLTTLLPEPFYISPIVVVSNVSDDYVNGSIDFAHH